MSPAALILFDVTGAPIFLFLAVVPCLAAELKPEAVPAYDRYIHDTDARLAAAKPFLWVDATIADTTATRRDIVHPGILPDASRESVPTICQPWPR